MEGPCIRYVRVYRILNTSESFILRILYTSTPSLRDEGVFLNQQDIGRSGSIA